MKSKIAECLSLRCKFITSKTVEMVVIDSDTNEIWIKRINFREMPKISVDQVEKLARLEGPSGRMDESQGVPLDTGTPGSTQHEEGESDLPVEEKEGDLNE